MEEHITVLFQVFPVLFCICALNVWLVASEVFFAILGELSATGDEWIKVTNSSSEQRLRCSAPVSTGREASPGTEGAQAAFSGDSAGYGTLGPRRRREAQTPCRPVRDPAARAVPGRCGPRKDPAAGGRAGPGGAPYRQDRGPGWTHSAAAKGSAAPRTCRRRWLLRTGCLLARARPTQRRLAERSRAEQRLAGGSVSPARPVPSARSPPLAGLGLVLGG